MNPQQFPKPRSYGGGPVTRNPSQSSNSDNDRSTVELRALDCNLTSLCEHVQSEGFNNGVFSDIVVLAMGCTYHLHRLILSRSSYFRNMLQGPWKEATAPVLTLHVDDDNVDGEAIALALAYLYGHHPKLSDSNAFRVLAAASFLDLQDLCAICTDFIISELWTSNILAYQVFAESQDYGIHGERVRNACWGYLCQSGAMELKEVLPKLSSQTLHALLSSDALWIPSEEKRFELALYILLAKVSEVKAEYPQQDILSSRMEITAESDSSEEKVKKTNDVANGEVERHDTADSILIKLADCVVDSQSPVIGSKLQVQETAGSKFHMDLRCQRNIEQISSTTPSYTDDIRPSSCIEASVDGRASVLGGNSLAMEGPSEEGSCSQLNNCSWLGGDHRHSGATTSTFGDLVSNDWGKSGMPLSCSGGTVCRRELKTCSNGTCGLSEEDYEAFYNLFEGGSLLYCNMTFEALLNVRRHLEEFGFPCKSASDGLWLQMLLRQRVQEVSADTCKSCCLVNMACQCRQQFGFTRGISSAGYFMQEHDESSASGGLGDVYVTDSSQGIGNSIFRQVRVHARGPSDGLAGIGRGSAFVPAAAWPPTRFVFSRVPFNIGNRNSQQSVGNDDPDHRVDHIGDLSGDGLTALVGLSQGTRNISNLHAEVTDNGYEADVQSRGGGQSMTGSSSSGIPTQTIGSPGHSTVLQWENSNSSKPLDIKTPLSQFPPFRFAVEFQEVHRLSDGQVKHSPEFFYAGSLWKISVQAFNDEDPQGRRTLGLFLHRRKSEISDSLGKIHMYVDAREKVMARYQLICPSKREVMVFGNLKQTGTLLPKAPKGWGWRTALLFDELGELLQNGALRIAAVVQLI